LPSGTYIVDEQMVADLKQGLSGQHASNLGGILAIALAERTGKPAYIVDPVVVDELDDLARFSGHPDLPRKSIFHALNHKAVARKAASRLNKSYEQCDLIVAHLGGGISVASHHGGRVVDVNNALDGDGPFSPERSGTLPVGDLVRLCFSGKKDLQSILQMIKGKGGIFAYLGTNDMRRVAKKAEKGDSQAEMIYKAMAYQIAKEIAAQGAVLNGRVDAVVITGGIAHDKNFIAWIEERCSFLAPIMVIPGEEEMQALAEGALRVLKNIEQPKLYSQIEVK
jgi:butyrate kinase